MHDSSVEDLTNGKGMGYLNFKKRIIKIAAVRESVELVGSLITIASIVAHEWLGTLLRYLSATGQRGKGGIYLEE